MIKMRMTNMMFYGFHGYYEYEREQGQKFFLDVELRVDENSLEDLNRFEEAANAARVYEIVKELMENHRFHLLAELGIKIADALLEKIGHIDEALVRVRKPSVPIAGCIDYVETEVVRKRQ